MKNPGLTLLFLTSFFAFVHNMNGQVYTNKIIEKKGDTLATKTELPVYPYALPILGKKAAAKGFDLPYSAGISINYIWQNSDIIIENLMVGFNDGTMYDLSDLVKFDKAKSTAQGITVRPDFWLLPFLNVYGIIGRTSASTDVGFGFWIPDSTSTEKEIFSTESKVDFKATSFGFGLTPTIGVMGGWIALDMNFTWTDIPQLNKPAFAFIFGPRIGKTFRFKKKDCNLAVWAGGFRLAINTVTNGSVNLSDVLSTGEFQSRIDQGYEKVASSQQQVDAWWESLTPLEQRNPVNVAKYDKANELLEKAGGILSSAETAAANISGATVQYSMDKRPENKWNFIIGTQFQLNKHLMARAEVGFLSSRTQFLGGLQYRFGL